jgi:hypothetical protein
LKSITVILFILVIAVSGFAQDAEKTEPGNLCYSESVEVEKGDVFPVKVYVNNVDTLAGMQVPIYYRSEEVDILCDSISFIDSRCSNFALKWSKIEPAGKVAFFTFIAMTDPSSDIPPLYPGEGLVATLWFTAPEDGNSGKVELYSGEKAFLPHPKIDYSFLFWTPGPPMPEQKECAYNAGYITVK